MTAITGAAAATGFTFLATTLGASAVFLLGKSVGQRYRQIFLGFAAGVMIAAAVWSLLIPAIEATEANGGIGWIPAAGGFVLGALFLATFDTLLPHLHPGGEKPEGPATRLKRSSLLIVAVTLHNIPEGMAVGLSFALAAQSPDPATLTSAFVLALGIGIQNIPEGAAVSLPLSDEGLKPSQAFLWGSFSGIVEPIFGILAVLISGVILPVMPWLLAFAAGAMIFVVVEELIPEARLGEHSHFGTAGVLSGFVLMMILDVALG